MRVSPLRLTAVLLGLAVAGCRHPANPDTPIVELPRDLSVAEQQVIAADNRFAFNLFREIVAQEDPTANVFVSPLSVAMALGMAYNGAAGTTRDAMQATLELQGLGIEDVNRAYRSLIDLLRTLDPGVEFAIGNSVWHDDDPQFTPRAAFLDAVRTHFDAEITALDFGAPDAPDAINAWVSDATRGRIERIIDQIAGDVVAYLINAIYFKGDWRHQFDEERTRAGTFRRADGSDATVDMMSYAKQMPLRHHYGDGIEIVDLSYGGDAYRMTIVLPAEPSGVHALAGDLTQERWQQWIAALDSTDRFVSMPKYTVEYDLEMSDVLSALGMEEAFCSSGIADFANLIAGAPPGLFCISRVLHKTFINVDEKGTEAAAATAVEVGVTSLPPTTVVDRPFVFAIRERLSGTILFMGRIMDPSG